MCLIQKTGDDKKWKDHDHSANEKRKAMMTREHRRS